MIIIQNSWVLAIGLAAGLFVGDSGTALGQPGGIGGGEPDPARLSTASTNAFIAVESPNKDGVKVYVIDEGTWVEYRAPQGTRARPLAGVNYIATLPTGPKITQLAAFSDPAKGWVTLDLPVNAERDLQGPILSPNIAVYVDGRRVYAYSSLAAKWGVLELPEGAEPHPITTFRVATVLQGDRLHVFNAKFGRWDDSGPRPK